GGEVVVAAGVLIASTLLTVLLAGPLLRLLRPFDDVTDRAAGHPCACRGPTADHGLRGAHHRSVRRARALADRNPGNGIPAGAPRETASELRLHASDVLVASAPLAYLAAGALGWLLALRAPAPRRTAVILPTAFPCQAAGPPGHGVTGGPCSVWGGDQCPSCGESG